jgi:hypothetical protein
MNKLLPLDQTELSVAYGCHFALVAALSSTVSRLVPKTWLSLPLRSSELRGYLLAKEHCVLTYSCMSCSWTHQQQPIQLLKHHLNAAELDYFVVLDFRSDLWRR